MSNYCGANLMQAIEPFTDVEIQTVKTHQNHVGYRADNSYFDAFSNRKHAIRLALTEFDVLALMGDVPPPKLYVFVTCLSPDVRVVEPIYRGHPFWTQRYFGNFEYADRASDRLLFELMKCCQGFGGMLADARTQFEKHSDFTAGNRRALGIERKEGRKG